MQDLAAILTEAVQKTPVGEKVVFNFKGLPRSVDIEMTFVGGWVINQTVVPGNSFVFTRGEDQYLKAINIKVNDYQGLQASTTSNQ